MLIEFWPIRAHRRIQVELALPHELTGQNRDQSFGSREDQGWRVVLPGLIVRGVTAPKIDDDFAVKANVKCATVPMRGCKRLRECLTEWLESSGHRTLYVLINR